MSLPPISFYFNKNDPEFKTFPITAQQSPYIGHWFITAPLYNSSGVKIGYKASDDYIQQISDNQYLIRLNNIYYIDGQGTITWNYAFINNNPNPYYPDGTVAKSNIVSTTGNYLGTSGIVSLTPQKDGRRDVTINFSTIRLLE